MNSESLPGLLKRYQTQAVADAVQVHPDTVRTWKSGEAIPTLLHVPALAQFLRIDVSELVAIATRKSQSPMARWTKNASTRHEAGPAKK